MKRRNFLGLLGSAAGAALFAPFLRQALATGAPPTRFVFVIEGNGIEPRTMVSPSTLAAISAQATQTISADKRWFPDLYGHSSALAITPGDLADARSLGPLRGAGGADDISGLASVVLGLSSTITGGGHSTFHGALACCRGNAARAGGQTIDSLLASTPSVRNGTPFDAVRVGIHSRDHALSTSTCANGPGLPAPIVMDPLLAFNNLFGSVAGVAGQAAFKRRGDLLDFASDDVTRVLEVFSGNSAERAKLERYLASLVELRDQYDTLFGMQPVLDAVKPDQPLANELYTDPFVKLRAQTDLVAAALIGGLTNVAVIASGPGYDFDIPYPSLESAHPALEPGERRHNLHHTSASSSDYVEVIHDATKSHVDIVGHLARALRGVTEDGGTMLDNTLIIYLSDNGEQHHSNAIEWPVLLVGGQNMGFQNNGQTTVYPGHKSGNNRQMSNLFNTLGHAGGLPLNTFGAETVTRIAEGPLSELWSPA